MPDKPSYQSLVKKIRLLEKEAAGRQKAEEELREGREHLRSLMESASNFAVYRLVHDKENPYKLSVVFVSPSIKEIMGLQDPLRFESWFENMHPEDVERVTAANLKAFETFKFDEIYRHFHASRGEWRWLHAVSTGVIDEGRQTRYVNGIIVDITNMKKAEEALQESHRTLDQKVRERTDQLRLTNEQLGTEIEDRKRAELSLKASKEKLRLLSTRLIKAQEEERKRLAFEVHDELGQVLVGLKYQIFSLNNKLEGPADPLKKDVEKTLASLDRATEKVRGLSRDLTTTALEHLGLSETLRLLFDDFSKAFNVRLLFKLGRLSRIFSYEQEINIFRIFQEALTNIRKHAQADTVSIYGKNTKGRFFFTIEDNGNGFEPRELPGRMTTTGGLGLIIMEERSKMAGGAFAIESGKAKGTRITFSIPTSP